MSSCIKKGTVKSFNVKKRGRTKGKGFGYATVPDLKCDVLIHTDTCFNFDQEKVRFANPRSPEAGDCVNLAIVKVVGKGYRAACWSYVVAAPAGKE